MTDAKLGGLEERSVDVKGVRMRYFVGGEGPPLLLVHGLGGAASNWTELIPLLAGRHRLLVPDLPGHGCSSALPAVSGLEPFADRVALVAEREGMLPAPVVGHSLGGMIVLRLALRRPADVEAVVLAGAAGLSIGNVWGRELLSLFTTVRPGRLAARYRGLVTRSPLLRRLVFGFVSVADPVALTEEAVEGFLAAQLLHTDVDSAWQALRRDDPRQELEAVRCPVLVLWGSEDVQLPLDDAFEYTRRLRARLRVIPGCGHLLIGERPDACDQAIADFLGDRSLERHHLPACLGRRRRQEFDPVGDNVDGAALLALVLPGAVPEPPLDSDLSPLGEVLRTELGLPVPDRNPEEVRLVVLPASIDRDPESRESFLLAELAHLDIARQISDQDDAVHGSCPPSCR
jgi:3-oxoadipate enol-lactonase